MYGGEMFCPFTRTPRSALVWLVRLEATLPSLMTRLPPAAIAWLPLSTSMLPCTVTVQPLLSSLIRATSEALNRVLGNCTRISTAVSAEGLLKVSV